jgi:hypothetical protein
MKFTANLSCLTTFLALSWLAHLYCYVYRSYAGIAQRYSARLRAGWSGFRSRQELGIFHLITASRPALGPPQPPIQWVPGPLSLGVKRPEREANHSPPSSAEIKLRGAIPPLPNTPSCRDAQLNHRDNFTLPYVIASIQIFFKASVQHLKLENCEAGPCFWTFGNCNRYVMTCGQKSHL